MPTAYTHQHPTSGWVSEPAAPNPGALPVGLDLRAGRTFLGAFEESAPPSLPQRPDRGAPNPLPLPAGGTTAGLPNLPPRNGQLARGCDAVTPFV
jgi:hypothetical protein